MRAELSERESKVIAKRIKRDVYRPINTYKTSVFLCGGDISNKTNVRYKVAEYLKELWWVDLIYPEDIFEELLYSHQAKNLLALEEILADSVDVVAVIPESPGSYAELAAFSNNDRLKKKMVCILDQKYKKDKSFLNQGPIKMIRKENTKNIIHVDYKQIEEESKKIENAIRKQGRTGEKHKPSSHISLLQLENFILPSIYLLEPVSWTTLKIMASSVIEESENAFQMTQVAISALTKKRYIEKTGGDFKLTTSGLDYFYRLKRTGRKGIQAQKVMIDLDNLRLEIMNLKYRKKKMVI